MNLWKCDNGTYDITDDNGEVVHQNVTKAQLATAYVQLKEAERIIHAVDVVGAQAIKHKKVVLVEGAGLFGLAARYLVKYGR